VAQQSIFIVDRLVSISLRNEPEIFLCYFTEFAIWSWSSDDTQTSG